MSIYEKDPVTGENTDTYYNMLQSGPYIGSEVFANDQRTDNYINPVASAYLAQKTSRSYDMNPELVINYNLLGLDDDHWQLNWRGSVYMNISNHYNDSFYPQELRTVDAADKPNSVNTSSSGSSITMLPLLGWNLKLRMLSCSMSFITSGNIALMKSARA